MSAVQAIDAPKRGDFVWITLQPQSGHEQSGRRPALVLSATEYNRKVGLMLACPVTNQAKGYPFEVAIPEGSDVTGVILADQVRSLDWRTRRAVRIGSAPAEVVAAVVEMLQVLLEHGEPSATLGL